MLLLLVSITSLTVTGSPIDSCSVFSKFKSLAMYAVGLVYSAANASISSHKLNLVKGFMWYGWCR